MNKIQRKNISKTLKSAALFRKMLLLFLGVIISSSVFAQITFTSMTQASSPRNNVGTTPADGQAVALTDTTGMGGLWDWTWTDINTGNIVQTTLQTPNITDTLNATSGSYQVICSNPDFFYIAKDTVTITAPGTDFAIGSDNGSLILCNGADSVNLTVLELCQYPFSGNNCGYI